MVPATVAMLGKTLLYIIEPGRKINSGYYCDGLLSQMIPEMVELSNGFFTFQQDGARSHTSRHTLSYLNENLPNTAELLIPENWPPNSPDLNPMDYSIWSVLAAKVFTRKIRDI